MRWKAFMVIVLVIAVRKRHELLHVMGTVTDDLGDKVLTVKPT